MFDPEQELISPFNSLPADSYAEKVAARTGRKAFDSSAEGRFARTMRAGMAEFSRMLGQGVSVEDAALKLEAVIRAAWPMPTTKFTSCPDCDGTGWRQANCHYGQRCGRQRCALADSTYWHQFAIACECPDGDKQRGGARAPEEQLAQVGRTPKRRTGAWREIGR